MHDKVGKQKKGEGENNEEKTAITTGILHYGISYHIIYIIASQFFSALVHFHISLFVYRPPDRVKPENCCNL